MGFLFIVLSFSSDFVAFEKSGQSGTPVDKQKSEAPFVLKARASAGFGSFRRKKMNQAMKNNTLKISSASYEVTTLLDSNHQYISANFHSLHGAPLPAFTEN